MDSLNSPHSCDRFNNGLCVKIIMATETKAWYKSKTKWAGIVAGVLIFANVAPGWIAGGNFPTAQFLEALFAVLATFGLRDLPIINSTK